MSVHRVKRTFKSLAAGAILLQAGSCDATGFNEFLQTVFLGITAAGSFVLLQEL